MLKNNLLKILELEDELVIADRSKGLFSMKISSIVLFVFSVLYLFSPIDIVPECIVTPKLAGYIDDAIVWIFVGFYIFKDLYFYLPKERRSLSDVEFGRVHEEGDAIRESTLFDGNESVSEGINISNGSIGSTDDTITSILSSRSSGTNSSSNTSTASNSSIYSRADFEEDSLQ